MLERHPIVYEKNYMSSERAVDIPAYYLQYDRKILRSIVVVFSLLVS